MSQGPVDKCKCYPLEAAIWESTGENGKYYNVSLSRTYTTVDPQTGKKEYHQTSQLRSQDLLTASELLRHAWYKVRTLEDREREGKR